jgi:hypothetical protein
VILRIKFNKLQRTRAQLASPDQLVELGGAASGDQLVDLGALFIGTQ